MRPPDIPQNEAARLKALREYNILDTLPESEYDDLTEIAASICGTPISLVSLIDDSRQFFKSHFGLDTAETPREYAFCAHAINRPNEMFVVEDARKDDRFSDNPLVTGDPNVIFYAGMPIVSDEGYALGTLCVIDHEPKELTQAQHNALSKLANQVGRVLELRKANAELKAAHEKECNYSKEMELFAASAAHDIKDPVQGIGALMTLLKTNYGNELPTEALECINLAQKATGRLHTLVGDLLNYARSFSSNMPMEDVDLNALAETVMKHHELRILASNASINIGELPVVQGSDVALRQMFVNLVGNALKFIPKGRRPEIAIYAEATEKGLSISVSDNGVGIKPEHQKKIFKSFTRLNNQSEYAGTGLGLSLCKRIADAHGADIEVSSVMGEGSTFSVVFLEERSSSCGKEKVSASQSTSM